MKREMFLKITMLIIIALAFMLYLYVDRVNPEVRSVEPTAMNPDKVEIKYDYNSHAQFYSLGNNFFYFCTKDGISYRSLDGSQRWNDVFDMAHPTVIGNGNYVAVAELKGKNLYVYGPSGRLYNKSFDYPVSSFSVNSIGYSSVTILIDKEYKTYILNDRGEARTEQGHLNSEFPVAYSLSSDARLYAFSSLDISGVQMLSKLTFAAVSESNTYDKIDGLLGGFQKDNQLIAELQYMENNMLISVSDSEICGYTHDENDKPVSKWSVPLTNEIKGIKYNASKGFSIALGRGFKNMESKPENTLEFYNLSGELIGTYTVPKQITYLSTSSNGSIVGCGTTYYAFNLRGQLLWEWNSTMELKQVLFLSSTDTILATGDTEAFIMKRGRR